MTFQNQKVQIEEAALGLSLAPLARLIDLVTGKRLPAAKVARMLGAALAEIADRHDREPARIAYSLELRRRAKLDRSRARQLRDGEDAPALTPSDLKALAVADAVEATAVKGKRGAPAIRAKAGRVRTVVGDAVIARGEARRADLRLAQTIELEAVREGVGSDQVLEARRGERMKRLRTRDGLKLAHERGTFAPKDDRSGMADRIEADRLLSLGLRYRDRYELAQASLRSCLEVSDRAKASSTLWVQATAARRRAALANQVRLLDIAVVTRHGADALLVLRMVAGEARTIRSLSPSSRQRAAYGVALVEALRVVGDVLGAAT